LEQLLHIVSALEENRTYINLNPKCEPQLGRRGLFRQMGGTKNPVVEEALLWVLNFSDGSHSLLDIAARSGLSLAVLATAAHQLKASGLLK
jgi:aminopeptidase-like protein